MRVRKRFVGLGIAIASLLSVGAVAQEADQGFWSGWKVTLSADWSDCTGEYDDLISVGGTEYTTSVEMDGELYGTRLRLQKSLVGYDWGFSLGYATGDFTSSIERQGGAKSEKDFDRDIWDFRVEWFPAFGWEGKLSTYFFLGVRYEEQEGTQTLEAPFVWTGNLSATREETMDIFTGSIGMGVAYALPDLGGLKSQLQGEGYGIAGYATLDTSDGWFDNASDTAVGAGGNVQLVLAYPVETSKVNLLPFAAIGYQAEWIGFGEEVGMSDLFTRGMYARVGLRLSW